MTRRTNVRALAAAVACLAALAVPARAEQVPAGAVSFRFSLCFDPAGGPSHPCGPGPQPRGVVRDFCEFTGPGAPVSTGTVKVLARTRSCTVSFAYLNLGACLTVVGGEVWVYDADGGTVMFDMGNYAAAGQTALAAFPYYQNQSGQWASGAGAGTVSVVPASGDPCAVGDEVRVTMEFTVALTP
jgi:hypothetical protein